MYDYVVVTQLPSFYKVNLYNELNKRLKIFVIFLGSSSIERTDDFTNNNFDFNYKFINKNHFENRNIFKSIINLIKILSKIKYKKIILSGWNLPEFWISLFMSPIKKNCLALESNIYDSKHTGTQALVKKIFLRRINTVFASGSLHKDLLLKLNYNNHIFITQGVGIINKPKINFENKEYIKNYIFLGRLSREKNIKILISVFNELKDHNLLIVGKGPEKDKLHKLIKSKNINILDHIDNNELQSLLKKQNFLILPSIKEPWGLVVEEALYFGLPVIISNNCGSRELIEEGENGFKIDPNDKNYLKSLISKIENSIYLKLVDGTKTNSIDKKDKLQIEVYKKALTF